MYGAQLLQHYRSMRDLGLVRSKRDFAVRWLKRGKTYLRDIEFWGRGWRPVSSVTTMRLRTNLIRIAAKSSSTVAEQIAQVLATMARDELVARALAR